MSVRSLFITTALAAFVAMPLRTVHAAPEQESHSSWCMLASLQVTQVASLYTTELAPRGSVRRFAGAQVFIPAKPGLTPEWIQANIARHEASKGRPAYDCPLDVAGARVTVTSGGTGFWVQIASKDPDAAREILSRARRLVR